MNDETPQWLARMQARSLTSAGAPAGGFLTDFSGVSLYVDAITHDGSRRGLQGVSASVESAGEITKRMTATRVIGGGLLFGPAGAVIGALAKKKRDDRELYLYVDGPDFQWVVPVDPTAGAVARAFAARINTEARELS